ncbi:MAG: tetratricopeptide repeat protein [Gammaproteobacteria bacterium]
MDHEPVSFLARLKRHHIYRVATFYAIASYVLIQVANNVFPDFGVPRSSVRIVIAIVALGFPVVLLLAWLFVRPVDPEKLAYWQRRRWRLGAVLSAVVIAFVGISGTYIWKITAQSQAPVAAASEPAPPQVFSPPADSIAVLPFRNLSNDHKQQYFSDGISQELTDALSRIKGMRVIAWQSMQSYRNTVLPVNSIGQDLDVAYLLAGSVMRDGDRVRVSTELVNTTNGEQLWSSRYDRAFKDVFAMQDDISKAIVVALKLNLSNSGTLVATATGNPKAHDAYLKGMAALNRRTATDIRAAIKYFQRAIKLDSGYAEAYAQLASVYTILPEITSMSYEEANTKAMPMIQKALAINPDQPKAHAVLANIYISEHKIDAAKAELLKTLALDPSNASAHTSYGNLLPLEDALAQYQQAAKLNPEYWATQMNLGVTYAELGRNAEAIQAFKAARKLAPQNIDAPLEIAFLYHLQARDDEAVKVLNDVRPSDKSDKHILEASLLSYKALQEPALRNQALIKLDRLVADPNSAFGSYYLALSYILLGEKERAIKLIAQMCNNAPDTCNDIAVDKHYQTLHVDPAFQKLMTKYNLKNQS